MLRLPLCLLLLFCTLFAEAQDSLDVLRVSKPAASYTITPPDSVLRTGTDNRICIRIAGEGKIAKVELTGGTITKKDNCYIAHVSLAMSNKAILSVYEELPGGDSKLVAVRDYRILPGIDLISNMRQSERMNDE